MNSKPTIFVFTTSYAPFMGGAEIAIQEITRRLGGYFNFVIFTSRFEKKLLVRDQVPEGRVVRVGIGSRIDKILFPVFGALAAVRMARKENMPLLFWGMDLSHGALAGAIASLFCRKIPFVFTLQYGYGDARVAYGRLGMIGLAFRFLVRRSFATVSISRYLADLARRYGYRGKEFIIPNGVDGSVFRQKNKIVRQPNSGYTVITTSRLVQKNGIDILIRAIAEARRTIPDIVCTILGDGEERINLEKLARGLSVDDCVHFLGNIPYEKLPEYLHNSDVFVRPSRSEGMGNSFVEALAAGIPIIGTPVGGIPDIIQDGKTGFMARSEDSSDLADKIIWVHQHPDLAQKTVEDGQRMVEERFSWPNIGSRYYALFSSFLTTSRKRIVIATPLMPPQLGGPARYAARISEEFELVGHDVRIVSFGSVLHLPRVIRHGAYGWMMMRAMRGADIALGLDYGSIGLAVYICSKLFRVPYVIRCEGDFLWEQYVERTRMDVTLPAFYQEHPAFSLKERFMYTISGWVLRSATRVVFSSEWRRNMISRAYGILESRTAFIKNVWEKPQDRGNQDSTSRVFLWAGRMLYLKNLERLIRVFGRIGSSDFELHLVGDGPERERIERMVRAVQHIRVLPALPHDELLRVTFRSWCFILPSLSDVGPNVVADAWTQGVPVVMTKESGYTEYLGNAGVFVDPIDEDDMEKKIRMMMDADTREEYVKKISALNISHTWNQAAGEWIRLLAEVEKGA